MKIPRANSLRRQTSRRVYRQPRRHIVRVRQHEGEPQRALGTNKVKISRRRRRTGKIQGRGIKREMGLKDFQ